MSNINHSFVKQTTLIKEPEWKLEGIHTTRQSTVNEPEHFGTLSTLSWIKFNILFMVNLKKGIYLALYHKVAWFLFICDVMGFLKMWKNRVNKMPTMHSLNKPKKLSYIK